MNGSDVMLKTVEDMFDYVEKELNSHYVVTKASSKTDINYSRFEHIKRVYNWMFRLYERYENKGEINFQALQIATIFHDVGYGIDIERKNHANIGAEICRKYLKENNYEQKLIDEVYYLIDNHSRKDLMFLDSTPLSLVLLMEADLLDDEGALGLVMDAMIVTKRSEATFDKVYDHMMNYAYKITTYNPMRTNVASAFWKEKQQLVIEFIRQLRQDLAR
jgi:uncharacterized protein